MSYFKVVRQNKGNGVGRAKYLFLHSEGITICVYSNIVEDLFMYANENENLQDETYRKKMANRFNQILKYRQNDYKTKHLVISFSHLLNYEEIEKALSIIESTLAYKIADTTYLIVVHQESNHRTAFHIVVSRDSKGKIIDFSQKEFFYIKKELAEQFKNAGLMNEREIKAYENLKNNKTTKEYKNKKEDIKNQIKDISTKIIEHLQNGNIKNAKALVDYYSFETKEYRVGEKSPVKNETLKKNRLYVSAVIKDKDKYKRVYIRADKHLRAFFSKYVDFQNKLSEIKKFKKKEKEYKQGSKDISVIPDFSFKPLAPRPSKLKKIQIINVPTKGNKGYKSKFLMKEIKENINKIKKRRKELDQLIFTSKIRKLNNMHRGLKEIERLKINLKSIKEMYLKNIEGVNENGAKKERRIFRAYRKLQKSFEGIPAVKRRSREIEPRKVYIGTIKPAIIRELGDLDVGAKRSTESIHNQLQKNRKNIERYAENIEQLEKIIQKNEEIKQTIDIWDINSERKKIRYKKFRR